MAPGLAPPAPRPATRGAPPRSTTPSSDAGAGGASAGVPRYLQRPTATSTAPAEEVSSLLSDYTPDDLLQEGQSLTDPDAPDAGTAEVEQLLSEWPDTPLDGPGSVESDEVLGGAGSDRDAVRTVCEAGDSGEVSESAEPIMSEPDAGGLEGEPDAGEENAGTEVDPGTTTDAGTTSEDGATTEVREGDEADGGGAREGGGREATTGGEEAVDLEGLDELASGDLDLVDTELAEHQRWAGAREQVGEANSIERAGFVMRQIRDGLLLGAQGGFGMGTLLGGVHRAAGSQLTARVAASLGTRIETVLASRIGPRLGARLGGSVLSRSGAASQAAARMAARLGTRLGPRVAAQAARFTPLPAVGAVIGGVVSFHSLYTRDWRQTRQTLANFGEGGSKYEVLANSIAAISEVVDIVSNSLNVIAGLMGVVTLAMWGAAILTGGILSPLAGTLTALSLAIGAVTLAMDVINMAVLQPLVTLFRAMHTFTSESDPREVVADGQTLSAAAANNGGAIGGLLGARAAAVGGARPNAEAGESTRRGDDTPDPAGEGGRVEFEARPEPPEIPTTPAADTPVPVPADTPATSRPLVETPSTPAADTPATPTTPAAPEVPAVPDVPATPVPEATPRPAAPESSAPAVPERPATAAAPLDAPEAAAPRPAVPETTPTDPAAPVASPPVAPAPAARPPQPGPDYRWVEPHTRNGKPMPGYWRRSPRKAGTAGAPEASRPATPETPAAPEAPAVPPAPAATSGRPPQPAPDYRWVEPYTRQDGRTVAGHWRRTGAGSGSPAGPTTPGVGASGGGGRGGGRPPRPTDTPMTPRELADAVKRAGRRARQASIRREGRKTAMANLRESVDSGIYDPQSARSVEDLGRGRVDEILNTPEVEGEPHPGSRAEGVNTSVEFSDLPRLADMPTEPQSGGRSYMTDYNEHRRGHHGGDTRKPIEMGVDRDPNWDTTAEPAREFDPDPDRARRSALDPDEPMDSGFEDTPGWQTKESSFADLMNDPELANHPDPRVRAAYRQFVESQSRPPAAPPATTAPTAPAASTAAAPAESAGPPVAPALGAEPALVSSAPTAPVEAPVETLTPPASLPEATSNVSPTESAVEPTPSAATPAVPAGNPASFPHAGAETPAALDPAPTASPSPDAVPTAESTPVTPAVELTPASSTVSSEAATPAAGAARATETTTASVLPIDVVSVGAQGATAASAGRASPGSDPSLLQRFFPSFYAGGTPGPSPEEQQAAFNAQFASDFPPFEGVERANPAYAEPPCTPAQIEAVRGHIAELTQARAQAAHAESQMETQVTAHEANTGPLDHAVETTEAGEAAVEQHEEHLSTTSEANSAQQQRQEEANTCVEGYDDQQGAIDGLRTPLRAFQGMMDLASYLPGDAGEAMQSMNQDAGQMLSAFDEMDASMAEQATGGEANQEQLQGEASQIEQTSTEASATGETLASASADATALCERNDEALAQATESRDAASDAGTQIDTQIQDQETQAATMAQQLQSWAVQHRDARHQAVNTLAARVAAENMTVTATHLD